MFDFPEKQTKWIGNFAAIWVVMVMLTATVVICTLSRPNPDQILVMPVPDGWFAQHEPVWTFAPPVEVMTTPLIAEDRAILASWSAVYAVDLTDGHILWQTEAPHQVAESPAPVLAGSRVLVPELGGTMSVYALADGKLLWSACPLNLSTDCHNGYSDIQSIATSNDYVAITLFKAPYFVYRLDTGYRERKSDTQSAPTIATDNQYLYIENSYNIDVVSFQDGNIIRSIPIDDGTLAQILMEQKALFIVRTIGTLVGYVEAIDQYNGRKLWSKQVSNPGRLTYDGGILYASADRMYAFDARSGEIKWQSELIASPGRAVLAGGTIIVRDSDGRLYAFDKNTGDEIGRLTLPETIQSYGRDELNPAGTEGVLIFPVISGQVYAYRP